MMTNKKEKENSRNMDLVDLVFSWSISDVMNHRYYSGKVKQIPETFISTDHYLKSYIYPLMEETRADLCSNLMSVSHAPICKVFDVEISKKFKLPKDLYYFISLASSEKEKKPGIYDPASGDLIAFTDVKPKCIDDLNRPTMPYVLAIIQGTRMEGSFKLPILSSKPIEFTKENTGKDKRRNKLFAVYLTNLTTNNRIWKSLHSGPAAGTNMKILRSVLQVDPNVGSPCTACFSGRAEQSAHQIAGIQGFGLDKSQETAILKCIATKDCHHQNMVELIWGPPGTGKTKTVASLLFALLQMKCRTLTCAPTNVAVVGVINRLMTFLRPTLKFDTYGLGDIILFGNGERLKIDDYEELFDVFLDNRVEALKYCFSPVSGFKGSSESMIELLQDPKKQYYLYLENQRDDDGDDSDEGELEEVLSMEKNAKNSKVKVDVENLGMKGEKQKYWRKVIAQTMKENKKKKGKDRAESQKLKLKKKQREQSKGVESLMSFEEFFMKKFVSIGDRLITCMTILYTHMPTLYIQVEVAEDMARVVDMLQALRSLFQNLAANGGLIKVFNGIQAAGRITKRKLNEVIVTRDQCLLKLKLIQEQIWLPKQANDLQIRNYCLESARLIFCTASSSSKLHTEGMSPIQLLIVDEAAQLKECESTIPLQLAGLRHAILIGDQKQLPAMVQSKISEEAGFGRSLFERLVTLGSRKNLLNVQYRMHPSISLFPNTEFYANQIKDGPNVQDEGYKKSFLEGKMFGSYSFIDINHGKELFDERHSKKNPVEVYVVAEIIAKLHKQFLLAKQKVRVGCISPYKAQVSALQEKLGRTYSTDASSDFSVNVRSVDAFQGGEEDVIIISTVRCNASGSIGFLSDHQRTNVALTRARHCLWILGNSATLINSGSVWKKLVLDAKSRGCFYNAGDDKNLVEAISSALIDFGCFDNLQKTHSLIFKDARWKVCFRDEFSKSFARVEDSKIRNRVVSLLTKLSNGWRQPHKRDTRLVENCGASAELLELYEVKGRLKLIWTVDIQRDNSMDIQVIKVLDILPATEIPDLARNLDKLFGKYTEDTFSRCKHTKMEGHLVVPVSWPPESNSVAESLASELAAINLNDEPKPSSAKSSGNHGINKKQRKRRP